MASDNVVVFITSLLTIISSVTSCPRREDLVPCSCDWPDNEGSAYVTCSGLDNEQDLTNAAGALKGKGYIYSFSIDNSNFNFIPHDAFKGVRFVELEIKDSNLMALTDTEEAFVGLEDYLEIMIMTDCTLMNEWDWSIFRNLKKIMRLDIEGGVLESVGEELVKINLTSLEDIAFNKNGISYVYDQAFAAFKNLRLLSLNTNDIREIKRTMFPDPASLLMDLDFSYNQIEQLPDDLFTNMPVLESLSIGRNKILVLSEKAFSPIWEQLDLFYAMGNDLRCDCRMSWLLEKKFPNNVRAMCANPPEVKGKNLKSLTSKDLWCYKK